MKLRIKWAYFKKPSVLIGIVVLFFIILFLLNRGGSSGSAGSTVVTNSGPTDAQVASQTQLALAQIGAGLQGQSIQVDYAKSVDANNTALQIAAIQASLSGQSLQIQKSIADATIGAQVHGLDLQYQTALANNDFALNYAQQQFNYGIATTAMNVDLQKTLSEQQMKAYQFGTLANLASSLKKGKRDNAFALLTTATNNPSSVTPSGAAQIMAPNGSSGQSGPNLMNVISPITSLF